MITFRETSRCYPGVTPDGKQVIIYAPSPMMHAYWFDAEGQYLKREDREMTVWDHDSPLLSG